jgi:hypothetical protein
MIRRDRELLARASRTSDAIGQTVVGILGEHSRPDPARLRALGKNMATVSADLLARAAELDGRTHTPPARVLIDARMSATP